MKRFGLTRLSVALLIGFLSAASAEAGVITFDDLAVPSLTPLTNGYQGFNWTNFFTHTSAPNTGYAAGLVSAPNDVYNGGGAQASFSAALPFTLVSGYFTGAWNDGLSITVQGFNGATLLDSATFAVSSTAPTLETFNWTGLTQVTFASSGGTQNPNYGGNGTQFALDNLTIAPEPGMSVMVAAGLGGLILLRRKLSR